MRLITIGCLVAACAFAQKAESHLPVTDAEKIADALSAGPTFITKDATLLDWPSSPNGESVFSAKVGTKRMDLSSGHSRVSTRRTRMLRPRILSVDERQHGRPDASH
jgi:hypothetical protein